MFSDPHKLTSDLEKLELIEKATLRSVVQAIFDFRREAIAIFDHGDDEPGDMGEDTTREALDRMGMPTIPKRLFGKIDYKRARYLFLPDFAMRQALFVDSKAEKTATTATIQMSQTSMEIYQYKGKGTNRKPIHEKGMLHTVIDDNDGPLLVTTVFVKYQYTELAKGKVRLDRIHAICLPNGMLQKKYNPSVDNGIWKVGRHSDKLGEEFRVRVGLADLKKKAKWRVQRINPHSKGFRWDE